MPFIDRSDAGRQLAKALAHYKAQRPVVLALPRGGVPVAAEVATAVAGVLGWDDARIAAEVDRGLARVHAADPAWAEASAR